MAKSTWWIGLSDTWEVIVRTHWNAIRPQVNPNVHMWIKKQEAANSTQPSPTYEYSVWDTAFRKRAFFPVNQWSITGISHIQDTKGKNELHIHLMDPDDVTKTVVTSSDTNWNMTQIFTEIDYNISPLENWETYAAQNEKRFNKLVIKSHEE